MIIILLVSISFEWNSFVACIDITTLCGLLDMELWFGLSWGIAGVLLEFLCMH